MELPPVPIANIEAFLAVIGQWNLYDMEVRGVQFNAASADEPTLDLVLVLPGDGAPADAIATTSMEHEFVFRFGGVESVDLIGFGRQNVIGEYEFTVQEPGPEGAGLLYVEIDGTVGGSMRCLCHHVSVVDVRERQRAGAG